MKQLNKDAMGIINRKSQIYWFSIGMAVAIIVLLRSRQHQMASQRQYRPCCLLLFTWEKWRLHSSQNKCEVRPTTAAAATIPKKVRADTKLSTQRREPTDSHADPLGWWRNNQNRSLLFSKVAGKNMSICGRSATESFQCRSERRHSSLFLPETSQGQNVGFPQNKQDHNHQGINIKRHYTLGYSLFYHIQGLGICQFYGAFEKKIGNYLTTLLHYVIILHLNT